MKPIIRNGKIFKYNSANNISTPNLDYDKLDQEFSVTDLRKKSVTETNYLDDKKDNKNTIINPGLLIEYENPQSDSTPHPSGDMYSNGIPWSDYN